MASSEATDVGGGSWGGAGGESELKRGEERQTTHTHSPHKLTHTLTRLLESRRLWSRGGVKATVLAVAVPLVTHFRHTQCNSQKCKLQVAISQSAASNGQEDDDAERRRRGVRRGEGKREGGPPLSSIPPPNRGRSSRSRFYLHHAALSFSFSPPTIPTSFCSFHLSLSS